MAIITISRGTLSGGRRLADCLGKKLGYRVFSREELVAEAASLYGVKEENLLRGLDSGPKFWDRFRIDRQIYLEVARATLCHLVRDGNIVYHGHAGHLLLQGVGHVVRVRIVAPMSQRIRMAVEEHGFSEGEADAYIQKRDEERRSWTRFLYGIEWGDPVLYDLTVNLEKMTIEGVCHLLAGVVERPEFRSSEAFQRELDDLFLSSHVHAKLYLNPRIAAAAGKITVKASAGTVRLSGLLAGDSLVREVLDTCAGLPEVSKVDADWLASGQTR